MQIPPVKELAMVSRPARAQVRLEVSREEPSSSVPKMLRGETKSGMRASMEEILPSKPTTMAIISCQITLFRRNDAETYMGAGR